MYKDKESISIDVRFSFQDKNSLAKVFGFDLESSKDASIVIWTTTPWTLPANQAVAVHHKLEYSLVEVEKAGKTEYLVLAQKLIEKCLESWEMTLVKVHASCVGEKLEHLKLAHPFYSREVPVILGDHVTLDAGTGAVHTAPAHGHDDYVISRKYDLLVDNPVKANGCYREDTELFAGQFIHKANPLVVEKLSELGKLILSKKLTHSYPHCWRHKTPLIFRATAQWFISMDKEGLRSKALAEIDKVTWHPAWGRNRIFSMIEDRPDWCISRQRFWGVPLPLILHKETGKLHPDYLSVFEKVAKAVEESGIEAWYKLELKDLVSDSEKYQKNNDVMDVWFDSGVTHSTVLYANPGLSSPADLYLEGSDQHRGWFHSSLLTSVAMNDRAPYKEVLTHGYTVDGNGHKMSKSLGNVIAPKKIIDTMGADVLRLWVSSAEYRNDIAYSEEIFKRASDSYRRIRNTVRFLLANLHDFEPSSNLVSKENLLPLDRWILSKASALQKELIEAYDSYNFHVVYHKLHNFCVNEMGGFYLDIIKDRQYTMPQNHSARRSCQTAMYEVVHAMTRWMAPILSFTADEAYQSIPGEKQESIFAHTWSDLSSYVLEESEMSKWLTILELRNKVNRELEEARNNKVIGSGLEAELTLTVGKGIYTLLSEIGSELKFVLITSSAKLLLDDNLSSDKVADEIEQAQISITASSYPKCSRCWHKCEDVGQDESNPELCGRCIGNITGKEENRIYA